MEKERFPFAAGRSVGIDDMSRLENGYGVRNVIERIKLNYGEKYGVTFESSPGNGTKVTIVVPVR